MTDSKARKRHDIHCGRYILRDWDHRRARSAVRLEVRRHVGDSGQYPESNL